MAEIIPPSPLESITTENGSMFQRFWTWTDRVTRAVNFTIQAVGSGNPEGVLSASAGKFYRDSAGPFLYWKSVDDVAGDKTLGWLLVV